MKFKEENVLYRSPNNEWLIAISVSSKGIICGVIYYRNMFMGFVNFGDSQTQKMFYNLAFPEVVNLSNELKKEYYGKKGEFK